MGTPVNNISFEGGGAGGVDYAHYIYVSPRFSTPIEIVLTGLPKTLTVSRNDKFDEPDWIIKLLKNSCLCRYVFDILNMLQGVYLFVIFVLKHSVLFEIRKKYFGQGAQDIY